MRCETMDITLLYLGNGNWGRQTRSFTDGRQSFPGLGKLLGNLGTLGHFKVLNVNARIPCLSSERPYQNIP